MSELSAELSSESDSSNNKLSKSGSIAKGTGAVGAMTFISRILGFIRDMVCARLFGAGGSYDAFLVAFKIPNFLRRLFAEGAFAQAFVPILSEYRAIKTKEDVYRLLNHVSGVLGGILLIVSIIGMIAAPLIIRVFAPGFTVSSYSSGERLLLASDLLRITFPYIFFVSLTAFIGSILNSFDKFSAPAFTPVLLNISMISSSLILAQYFSEPVTALAWGVFFGGIAQLLFVIFFVWKINLVPRPCFTGDKEGVSRILRNMIPAIFGVSVAQINLLFDTVFASFLPKGSISWLYYSDRLMEFPLGVFGVALATVVLPHLSRKHSEKNHDDFVHTLDWSLQLIVLLSIPAALGLFFLAEPLLITLFQYGKFTSLDVYKSSLSLKAFACGLFAFISIKILASANYARKDIKTPVRIAALCMLINIGLSLILMQFFYHVGLAMAGAITGFLNAGLLLYFLIKRKIYKPVLAWRSFMIKIIIANLTWVIIVKLFTPVSAVWLAWNSLYRISALLSIVSLVVITYFGLLRLLGLNIKQHLNI